MSATDELRRLLDERGVKHSDYDGITEWCGRLGAVCRGFQRYSDNYLDVVIVMTDSESAVNATLGSGKCKIVRGVCSRCGALVHESANMYWQYFDGGFRTVMHKPVNFCPNCGREVER